MQEKRETYEKLWKGLWAKSAPCPGVSYATRRRILLRLFDVIHESGDRILEVGRGNGRLLADFSLCFPDIKELIGTDISTNALKLAKETLPEACFFQCSAPEEPFALGYKVDTVICSEVLEHVDQWRVVIDRIADVLRPLGHLLITVPHSMEYWNQHDDAAQHLRLPDGNTDREM